MKKGDFIQIEFVGKIASTGEIFDLNSAEEAKKAGIFNPKHSYSPALVIIGAGLTIPGLEQQLEKMKVEQVKEFIVGPDQAFGPRNPKLIKIISLARFLEKKINPIPGIFVEINDRRAKVQSVSGGRVRVDFNSPLAGKELKYKVKIIRLIKETKEKISALLNHYGLKAEIKVTDDTVLIKSEKELNPLIKKLLEQKVTKWTNIKKVSFRCSKVVKKV